MPPAARRRIFLAWLSALSLARALRSARAGVVGPDGAAERLLRALLALLQDRGVSAALVGRAYLAGAPTDERDLNRLTRLIVTGAPALERAALTGDSAALRSALRQHCSEDFAEARTVRLEGWVLAATEARLCALHALASSNSAQLAAHQGLGRCSQS